MSKILIVSDDDFLKNMLSYSMSDMEVEVYTTADVVTMQLLCRKIDFDLIILFITTPFISGSNLVREVRPTGLRRPLFYVISWQHSEQRVLSLLENGIDQYITLPVSIQRLRVKISTDLSCQL